MPNQKTFTSLADLKQLLPESDRVQFTRSSEKHDHDGKEKTINVSLETKGRKGKSVTLVSGLHHNPTTMEDIARMLKQYCGAGGTVKDGNIEIQGDQRERVTEKLRQMNYIIV